MCDPQAVCKLLKNEIKPIVENYLTLQNDLIVRFKKENNKYYSHICKKHGDLMKFNYHGISDALCGKECFIPKRIVIIQMKENN